MQSVATEYILSDKSVEHYCFMKIESASAEPTQLELGVMSHDKIRSFNRTDQFGLVELGPKVRSNAFTRSEPTGEDNTIIVANWGAFKR
jgi:hypothetical protein